MSEITSAERAAIRRKNIIKNIAIVFLVILLLLTFFSQTIMNYSLPEVATGMVEPGTVSPQIRGTGTVEADDPYEVEIKETRKIASVAVKVGDHVDKGSVLYYLEEMESSDLKEAQEKLDDLVQSYEMSLLKGDIDDEIINRVRSGGTVTFETFQKQLSAANKTVEDLENSIRAVEAQIDAISTADSYTAEQYKYDTAGFEYTDADIELRKSQIEYQTDIDDMDIDNLKDEIDDLKDTISDLEDDMKLAKEGSKKYKQLLERYTAAQSSLTAKQNRRWELESEIESLKREKTQLELVSAQQKHDESQINTQAGQVNTHYDQETVVLNDQKTQLERQLDVAKDEQEEVINNISREIELDASRREIENQQKVVEELEAEALGGEVPSPIAGTVTSMTKVAGQSTSPGEVIAVIQVDGKDMVLSFSVSNDQAKNLRVGDVAEPQNAWYYTDFKATLKSITADSTSPNSKKKLTFVIVSPEVQAGQNLSLTIGERSDRYDLTVPSSAIREDSNGKFILIIKSKSSPLGNRYIANRVDVDVLASDDTTSAISGSLEGYEYVITTSTASVEAGNQVRLANNS